MSNNSSSQQHSPTSINNDQTQAVFSHFQPNNSVTATFYQSGLSYLEQHPSQIKFNLTNNNTNNTSLPYIIARTIKRKLKDIFQNFINFHTVLQV